MEIGESRIAHQNGAARLALSSTAKLGTATLRHCPNVERGPCHRSGGPCSDFMASLPGCVKNIITAQTTRLYTFAHFSLFFSNATIDHYRH